MVLAQLSAQLALLFSYQATVGFMPQMSWLQVIAWVVYLLVVGTVFGWLPARRAARLDPVAALARQ